MSFKYPFFIIQIEQMRGEGLFCLQLIIPFINRVIGLDQFGIKNFSLLVFDCILTWINPGFVKPPFCINTVELMMFQPGCYPKTDLIYLIAGQFEIVLLSTVETFC